ncbi:MAG: hypothetical protein AMJ95_03035 [Omnitrophica WOR_2 bacterium SM23_72]|nr:MAG: hypothetical protein AMJ95_03035 [Omnitrophica WOR_2 bacterium SM23_72]
MISIDFSLAIALFNGILLVLLLTSWIFSKKQKDKDFNLDPKFIWFCSICAYTYVNTKEEVISICPRCGNYNKK